MKLGQYIADLFAGTGGVRRAARADGWPCRSWEIADGKEGDLLNRRVRRQLRRDTRSGLVLGAALAPPCGSLSLAFAAKARWRDDRGHQLPNLHAEARRKCDHGDACLRVAVELCTLFSRCGVPWILEQPQRSLMWKRPEIEKLIASTGAFSITTEQCQWGRKWRKATRFLLGGVDPQDAESLARRCPPGICTRTGRPHLHLQGRTAAGTAVTAIAAEYPPALCKALVRILAITIQAQWAAEPRACG